MPTTKMKTPLPTKKDITKIMMECVGIVRTEENMLKGIKYFEGFMPDEKGFISLDPRVCTDKDLEIYNMLTAGWLIAKSAYGRKESFGAHYIENDNIHH